MSDGFELLGVEFFFLRHTGIIRVVRICGMDEVGRGALAGPLIAAAIVFSDQLSVVSLRDSKKLTAKQRQKLYKKIMKTAEIVEVEMISARQINNQGMGWANRQIFKNLIKRIEADKYIVDGPTSLLGASFGVKKNVECMIRADCKIPEVMAASIVAKVTRDEHMKKLHDEHKMY